MHNYPWHEPTPFMDFHYFLSKSKMISNYSQRAPLCLFSKHKYVNGACEPNMNNYDDMNERWY